jgi:hypothetical protein
VYTLESWQKNPRNKTTPEMEFLDIILTKDSSLLLLAIHSPFYWRTLNKTILFSGFQNPKKIRKTRKLESIPAHMKNILVKKI